MTGVQFEDRLAYYFKEQGYKVRTTASTGDHGAYLIIEKSG
jgi:HJR/Mrr/RecB family endonuclease